MPLPPFVEVPVPGHEFMSLPLPFSSDLHPSGDLSLSCDSFAKDAKTKTARNVHKLNVGTIAMLLCSL